MPQSCNAPAIHPGPLHVGPAIPWALRGPRDGRVGVSPKHASRSQSQSFTSTSSGQGQRRKKWNGRHQLTWENDQQSRNMRSYFDRYVHKPDIPSVPRRKLRPTWDLHIHEVEEECKVPVVFDAATASWKECPQWTPLPMTAAQGCTAMELLASVGPKLPPAPAAIDKPRTPRQPQDMVRQRRLEGHWDKNHGTVFSRFNAVQQSNERSYFDRWRDDGGSRTQGVTWKLDTHAPTSERLAMRIKSMSMPALEMGGKAEWVERF